MIGIYCRGRRHQAAGICSECASILNYAYQRIDRCPYTNAMKPACGLCRTNCFSTDMHGRFSEIMRYAGPRMILRHPALTLAHFWDAFRGARASRP